MANNLVIFDCDGVLIDSEVIACRVDSEALAALGIPMSMEEVTRRFAGVSQKDMCAQIEAEFGQKLPPEFEAETAKRARQVLMSELQPIPGVENVLKNLTSPFCIASSSTYEKLRYTLSLTGLYDLFAPNIFSSSEVENGKPSPDLFLYVAGRMNTPPSSCVVVEDSVAGVKAARAAGMHAIGFVGGGHCDIRHGDRLIDAGAGQVITRLEELNQVIPEVFNKRRKVVDAI